MWNNSVNLSKNLQYLSSPFLAAYNGFLSQQTRNTFILKRRTPPGLAKKNGPSKVLRGRHFVYELVEDTNVRKKPDLQLILTSYVEGLGNKGDLVTVPRNKGYTKLLLPRLATYATPENIDKTKAAADDQVSRYSSPYVERTINVLSTRTLPVLMSNTNPWVLEKWHIRTWLRRSGFHLQDESITLPDKPISGPNPAMEGKDFYITVTINKKEQVKVRCRLFQIDKKNFTVPEEYYKNTAEPIFPEDKSILDTMPGFYLRESKSSRI
ncbi:large ribosomal subunit protein bL9m [Neodiprion pinetum]|uniref:Large ribosomal subunit protein bL9m n=1 Tax=Neodiprion lecontei TaxID=441921 RepID=A0A6J0BAT0_NEOLC|nr:39S ribosomal protein L9, mitochondrial [Neodiprion lecontei]XP_046469131.1 39S ribosomal protein L9, mitochondrial [Neodiprion pinetum]